MLWVLLAAWPAMLLAGDQPVAPQKILDLLAKVEASQAAAAALDKSIAVDKAKLDEDTKARQDAVVAMAKDRAAFRAAWQEVYGDIDDLIPTPKPAPTPPPKPVPEPQPPAPVPVVKYTATLALILENPDERTPAQAAVNDWMSTHLRKADGTSSYLWYDSREEGIPANAKKYLDNPPPPKMVIFGKSPGKDKWSVLYNGPRPATVDEFKKVWTEKGGAL
jgi:hypothetical protein